MVRSIKRAPDAGELVELLVDQRGDALQLVLGQIGGSERVAALAVDPVEDADVVLPRVAERGVAMAARFGADIKRDAAAGRRLIHELRDRTALAGQQPPADERHAGLVQARRANLRAHALREPRNEMLLL